MDNIWDPHNVSAILRSCDAFGVLNVHLHYTDEKFPDIGKKSSASAKKWVQRYRHTSSKDMVDQLHKNGLNIVRTGFSDKAKPVYEYDFTKPTAVILGNEHRGVAGELCELVSDELYIPMVGMVQSFNVSVAAAIILYEAFSQRQKKGVYDECQFTDSEYARLVSEWSEK